MRTAIAAIFRSCTWSTACANGSEQIQRAEMVVDALAHIRPPCRITLLHLRPRGQESRRSAMSIGIPVRLRHRETASATLCGGREECLLAVDRRDHVASERA